MKNKVFISIIFSFSIFTSLFSQNLVPNPSFEIFTNCPLGPSTLGTDVPPWSSPDTATPDYYNSCYTPILPMMPSMDVPSNIQGYQNARTGVAYAGIISAENTFSMNVDYREYIQIQLTSPLVAGTNYCVEFYWSLADISPHYVQELGVYLSSTQTNLLQSTTLPFTPQLEQTGIPLDDTTNWVLFQQQYIATGGEEYIIIGNFRNPSNTTLGNTNITCNVLSTPSPGGCFAYYYIDDVSVEAGICSVVCDATIDQAGPFCSNDPPVTLSANTTGGTWSGLGITNASSGVFDPAVAGVGGHIITYSLSCGDTDTVLLSVTNCSCPIVIAETLTDEQCNGACDGEISIDITGGTGPYQVEWFDGANTSLGIQTGVVSTATLSSLCPGTYTVEVTESSGSGGPSSVWTEDFESGLNGWILNVSTGTNGADNNYFEIDDDEGGLPAGQCGIANNGDNTLHVTSVFFPSGGAAYDAGGLCGLLFCPETNRRSESPNINTTGFTGLTLNFNFIGNGDGLTDNASLWYNDGGGWTQLDPSLKSPVCGSSQGQWTAYSIALPVSCENIPNLQIGFNWTNNDDGMGSDPSFAVNDIEINSTSSSSGCTQTETYVINNGTLTIPEAGTNGTLSICATDPATDLFAQLGGSPDTGGSWSPVMNSGTGTFDPSIDAGGTYSYTVTNSCGIATADVVVTLTGNLDPGTNGSISLCSTDPATDLFAQLGGSPDTGGTWSPVMNSGTGTFDPSIDAGGTYTYTVTNSCGPATADVVVTIITSCTTISVNDTSACLGDSVLLTASGSSTGYSWADSLNITTLLGTGATYMVSPSITTTYAVWNATDTVYSTVTVETLNAGITTNSPICDGQALNLSATPTGLVAGSYIWVGPNGPLGGAGLATVNILPFPDPIPGGWYYLTVVDGICTDIDSAFVIANPIYDIFDTTTVCSGDNFTYADGTISTNILVDENHVSNFTTTASCDSIVREFLIVGGCPALLISSDTSLCQGDSILLLSSGSVSGYNWIDSVTLSPLGIDSFYMASPSVTTTYGVYNATDTVFTTVTVYNSTTATNVLTECQGFSITIGTNTYTTTGVYNDTLVGANSNGCDSIIITDLTINLPVTNPITTSICLGDSIFIGGAYQYTAGIYNDTLIGGSINGCDSIISTTLSIFTMSDASILSDSLFCESDPSADLQAVTSGGTWSGIGITNALSGTFNPSNAGSGTHQIIYTISGSCGDADSINIVVNENPLVSSVYDDDSCMLSIGFIDLDVSGSNPPYDFSWSNGAVTEDLSELASGIYWVIVTDNNDCTKTDTITIGEDLLNCSGNLWIPNIFSPNNDTYNDVLYVRGAGSTSEFLFVIFNRWGEKVFESSDPNSGWDGTFNGKELNDAVFAYLITATFLDGSEASLKGTVTLVK